VKSFEVRSRPDVRSSSDPDLQFSGAEHRTLANDQEYLQMLLRPNGEDFLENFNDQDVRVNYSSSFFPFTTPNTLNLKTYGNLVSTWGDYFGPYNEDDVICNQLTTDSRNAKILKVFNALWNSTNDIADYYYRIQDVLDTEYNTVRDRPANEHPYEVYANIGNYRFFKDFIGSKYITQFITAAFFNYDHFGDGCAQNSYTYIHALAQQWARDAGNNFRLISNFSTAPLSVRQSGLRAARDGLEKAYVLNAFADHFLSDLFAAGHMRTPRRAIRTICDTITAESDAGYAAKVMHDEDNRNGLWVRNLHGDVWKSFGDGMYFEVANAAARDIEREATQLSKNEIYDAFNGVIDQNYALNLVPNKAFSSQFDAVNICPMFQYINGELYQRQTTINRPNVWLVANNFSYVLPLQKRSDGTINETATACEVHLYKKYEISDCPTSVLSLLPGVNLIVDVTLVHSFNVSNFDPMTWTWTAAKLGDYVVGVPASDMRLEAVIGVIIGFIIVLAVIITCACCRCRHHFCYVRHSQPVKMTEQETAQAQKYQENDPKTKTTQV